MTRTLYLVDNNALATLKQQRIRSAFFTEHCRLTTDVLREANEHPDLTVLQTTEYAVSPDVLEQMRTVMKAVDPDDTGLVDLYRNKGMADPGLIASALNAMEAERQTLLPDKWVIVTNDRAVRAKAAELGVPTMEPVDLAACIDACTA